MTDSPRLHESAQQARVLAHVQAQIAAHGGFLPFDRYMQEVLYAPGLGYYSAGAHKLGAGGDFTTAPEISPLFGACVAAQCLPLLQELPGAEIIELGAGTGRLAFDVLHELARQGVLPARYGILEVSPDLRARQQALLATLPPELAQRVHWLDAPPVAPWRGVLLANEVLDALACELFTLSADGPQQRGVTLDAQGGLAWAARPAPAPLAAAVQQLQATLPEPLEAGYQSEVCTLLAPWLAAVTGTLQHGVALFFDYGLPRAQYYHPTRHGGTLRCHRQQRAHDDPLLWPGLQDITAWVDFTRVAEAADDCGLAVAGYTTQAAFLLGTGIEAQIAAAPDDLARARSVSQARELLMPEAMGEAFKAIALSREWDAPLAGFSLRDLRERL